MFGYVTINKMELKFKEYYNYKAYYCGLCKSLKENYSNISRMTLNYDMTFLILVLSSLYEPNNRIYKENCIAHPFSKQLHIHNEITDYVAAINIILSYYNLLDNWDDERDVKSLALMKVLEKNFKKASSKYPLKSKKIAELLSNIRKLEQENSEEIDAVSNEFGHIMEEIFAYKNDHWENNLKKVGFFIGKYIYFLDALEDMAKDEKNKSYNPFNLLNIAEKDKYIKELLMLNLSYLSDSLEKLPLVQDKGIIDNIMYSGILIKLNKNEEANKAIW